MRRNNNGFNKDDFRELENEQRSERDSTGLKRLVSCRRLYKKTGQRWKR